MTRVWNPQQSKIFTGISTTNKHIIVVARAGTGKTTLMLESLHHLPRNRYGKFPRVLVCAFNKSIKDEFIHRLKQDTRFDEISRRNIWVQTCHGLGLATIKRANPKVQINEHKTFDIIKEYCLYKGKYNYAIGRVVHKLVGLAKNKLCSSIHDILALMSDSTVDSSNLPDDVTEEILARHVFKVLDECQKDISSIDYDDMVWLPAVLNLTPYSYDNVFVDELQDLNAPQMYLIKKALGTSGRFFGVGDDCQAIYQFRGAGSDVMGEFKKQFDADTYPLGITYRCPKSVVALAQTIVPDYVADNSAKDGLIRYTDSVSLRKEASGGDFVISRANAPLLRTCLQLLADGKPAVIAGNDFANELLALIRKSKTSLLSDLFVWLDKLRVIEAKKLLPDHESKWIEVIDRIEGIKALSEGLEHVSQLESKIQELFADSSSKSTAGKIVCTSVHKAKGLETRRVWLLDTTFRRGQSKEEDNLYYVAITRTQEELCIVR